MPSGANVRAVPGKTIPGCLSGPILFVTSSDLGSTTSSTSSTQASGRTKSASTSLVLAPAARRRRNRILIVSLCQHILTLDGEGAYRVTYESGQSCVITRMKNTEGGSCFSGVCFLIVSHPSDSLADSLSCDMTSQLREAGIGG